MFVPGSIPNIILSLVNIIICLKKSILYKYINLLFRFSIGALAVWYIYTKLNSDFFINLKDFKLDALSFRLLLLTIILLFVNWGIEALKWRFAIHQIYKLSFIKALRLTFTGITIGLLTPNRIGEIPARASLLNSKSFNEIVLKTIASSFSQLVITFLLGGFGLFLTQQYFDFELDSFVLTIFILVGSFILLLLYFNMNKIAPLFYKIKVLRNEILIKALMDICFKELFILLMYSLLRYLIFFIQYWLVLTAFGIDLITIKEIFLIPVCFLFASSIPTILISEIGVRGSVALFVFGVVSSFEIQIILASIVLWLINVALPAIFGLYDLKEFKLFTAK